MKKILAAALSFVLALGILSGCGDSDSSKSKKSKKSDNSKSSTIADPVDDSSKKSTEKTTVKTDKTPDSKDEPASSEDDNKDYITQTSFSLIGKWKYIELDHSDERSSGLNFGDYRRQHENDSYKVYFFGEDHICYNETDDEYYPYTYYYAEYHFANDSQTKKAAEEGISFYTDDPKANYNGGKLYLGDDIGMGRVAKDTVYGENFILIRMSDTPAYKVSSSDKKLLENITGKWQQVNGGPDSITLDLYADGSARIYDKAAYGDRESSIAMYGIKDGVLYLDYYTKGLMKYTIELSGDSMTLNGEEDYHRSEKDGYDSEFSKMS